LFSFIFHFFVFFRFLFLQTSFFPFQTSFFFISNFIFSYSLPVAPEIQESHENQCKKTEDNQKQRKMKKK